MPTVHLMQGNCLELMRKIPDGSVDMVLCDLPYGTTRNKWDSVIPFDGLWAEWNRVCKKNAAVVLFAQGVFMAQAIMSNPNNYRYEWIYEKTNPTGFLNAKKMPMKYHENVLVFYKSVPTYNPQFSKGKPYKKTAGSHTSTNYGKYLDRAKTECYSGKRYPKDIITVSNSSYGRDKGAHPTQKPVALLEYFIRTYTNPGETVLDNCVGSGSTGVACVNTGRNFIGIELDSGYFQTAKDRIEKAKEVI